MFTIRKYSISLMILVIVQVTYSQSNPCDDVQFIKLKDKDPNSLTDREYNLLLKYTELCNEYIKSTTPAVAESSQINKSSSIIVRCYTSDVPIYIDGGYVGLTPIINPINVNPGTHTISIYPNSAIENARRQSASASKTAIQSTFSDDNLETMLLNTMVSEGRDYKLEQIENGTKTAFVPTGETVVVLMTSAPQKTPRSSNGYSSGRGPSIADRIDAIACMGGIIALLFVIAYLTA